MAQTIAEREELRAIVTREEKEREGEVVELALGEWSRDSVPQGLYRFFGIDLSVARDLAKTTACLHIELKVDEDGGRDVDADLYARFAGGGDGGSFASMPTQESYTFASAGDGDDEILITHQLLTANSDDHKARVLIGVAGATRCDFALRASIVHRAEEESAREEQERKRQAQLELDKEMIADAPELFGTHRFAAEGEVACGELFKKRNRRRSWTHIVFTRHHHHHHHHHRHPAPVALIQGLDLERHRPLSAAAASAVGGRKKREPEQRRRRHDATKLPLGAPEMTNAELLREVLRRDVTKLELGADGFYKERERERGLSAPGLRRRHGRGRR